MVAAVIVANTADGSRQAVLAQAVLDGLRSGLLVPAAGAVVGVLLTAAGLRKRAERAA
jgi:hypothetical protein